MEIQGYVDQYDSDHANAVLDALSRASEGRGRHTHLDNDQDDELYHLMWEAHNGDNTCSCMQYVVWAMQVHDELTGLQALRHCIANHDAGIEYRRALGMES